jgi:hypothetical protein
MEAGEYLLRRKSDQVRPRKFIFLGRYGSDCWYDHGDTSESEDVIIYMQNIPRDLQCKTAYHVQPNKNIVASQKSNRTTVYIIYKYIYSNNWIIYLPLQILAKVS